MASNLQLLIDIKLGYSVEIWIANAINQKISYRQMVDILYEETGIKVSKSSLYLWWNK